MKIIDKNYDYYDYLQDREDILVFDRRGSYILQKKDILIAVNKMLNSWYGEPYTYLLLQCGATYWLFFALGSDVEGTDSSKHANDCTIRLVGTWKDYNKPINLFKLQAIEPQAGRDVFDSVFVFKTRSYIRTFNEDRFKKDMPVIRDATIHGMYRIYFDYNTNKTYPYKGADKWFILKSSGISPLVNPEDMYNAIDEYFSLMKAAAESTVAEGTTNNDKIKNHGFDVKTSFRGGKKPV